MTIPVTRLVCGFISITILQAGIVKGLTINPDRSEMFWPWFWVSYMWIVGVPLGMYILLVLIAMAFYAITNEEEFLVWIAPWLANLLNID